MAVDNEQWLQDLKVAVEQGYYQREDGREPLEPLPAFPPKKSPEKAGPWTNLSPIDLDMACKGYLEAPERDGSRLIPGLECMARDLRDGGIALSWGDPPYYGTVAYRNEKEKRVILARGIYLEDERWVRGYVAGSVGMVIGKGKTDGESYVWAHRRYGALSWWVKEYR